MYSVLKRLPLKRLTTTMAAAALCTSLKMVSDPKDKTFIDTKKNTEIVVVCANTPTYTRNATTA
jgi:hydrogenase maturation factor HypF (carbamoyltransferase family)